MREINLIGFSIGSGTKWCHKPDDIHYENIAWVKPNGAVKWYMDKSKLPLSVLETIAMNVVREQQKMRELREGLGNALKQLENAAENSKEYFIAAHSVAWHRETIRRANL